MFVSQALMLAGVGHSRRNATIDATINTPMLSVSSKLPAVAEELLVFRGGWIRCIECVSSRPGL